MPYRACAVSVLAALAPALVLVPLAASAQYPEHPIRVVLPYAPGAAGDIALRQIQPLLEKRLGQPVVVDYKTGAGGNIGMQDVARAKPDGYTLVLGAANNFVINQFLYRKLGFDPLTDLAPVGKLADVPAFVYVSAQAPAADWRQFQQYARAHSGKLNYGSPGMGTTPHLSAYRLSKAMGADMTHIAYRGAAPGVQALLANEVQLYIGGYSVAAAYVPQGKVRALAVASPERFAGLPDVPTAKEAGMPDAVQGNWWGLAAPKGTPPDRIARFAAVLHEVLGLPEVRQAYLANGFVPGQDTPASFGTSWHDEARQWESAVRESGVVLD
ncbi:Bug family tripartite tricarboxylate transporter substrate binding protein [Achromobacter spanius]|uniref:ABC transporter substrate-binding protein n=1 Tax=Achromobacter spanius TaxID=217203 RepID=A0A2S0I9N8_9BURK|nr:tripartite tricarboxylate transporter substrate binding protein [Achromobacter spanius]AVJ28751.1 ABC transporter substrate-binding protein [Achromobacter spanius]